METVWAKQAQNQRKSFPGREEASAKGLGQECVMCWSCRRKAGVAESGTEESSSEEKEGQVLEGLADRERELRVCSESRGSPVRAGILRYGYPGPLQYECKSASRTPIGISLPSGVLVPALRERGTSCIVGGGTGDMVVPAQDTSNLPRKCQMTQDIPEG